MQGFFGHQNRGGRYRSVTITKIHTGQYPRFDIGKGA